MTSSDRPRFLMCAPTHFNTHFLFNPFMRYTQRIDRRRAKAQWNRLVRTLEDAGADVEQMDPVPASSALPFTADGAFSLAPGRAVILTNDGPRGEFEPPVFRAWFKQHGYQVESMPPRYRIDGGNLVRLPGGDVLAGLKPSASGLAERYLGRLVTLTAKNALWTVPLVDELYLHLDLVLAPLAPGEFLIYLAGLEGGRLPPDGPLASAEVVPVSRADARRFACNIVRVGDVVVTGPITQNLSRRISRLGYHVERVDLSEFYKAGGGARCLTLPLWPPPEEVRK